MRLRIWPYAAAFVLIALVWTSYVMMRHYQYWQATGQEMPYMASSIRNGALIALGLAVAAYAASFAWLHRAQAGSPAISGASEVQRMPTAVTHGFNGEADLLSQTGQKFVLEVRGMGIVVGEDADEEIWKGIEKKSSNYESYVSPNPQDLATGEDMRLDDLRVSTGLSFREGARHAVEYWPVPVIVWEPPKATDNPMRPATAIADARQKASLGVTLFLWQEDANTNDGAAMIEKLFAFFDAHPDVPAALVFCSDGSMVRSLNGIPDGSKMSSGGPVVPARPDSITAMLVSRSDRVDKLIRPYAVDQTMNINKNNTDYDVIKLWNYFWAKNDGDGPDGFNAYYKEQEKKEGIPNPTSMGFMSAAWWQAQLPAFWQTIGNRGPGQFTPSPYVPVRWTTWQLKQFDSAPLLGYLHRPIDVKLTDEQGKPLKTSLQADAIKAGWQHAVEALPDGQEPKRVFYDTSGDREWAIPLNQAVAQSGPSAPSLDNVKEGYDIGRRVGDTGVSSPLVQIGLGLIASYDQGGASATINRRPNGTASILMVSPPSASVKTAWAQKNSNVSPFK